MGDFQDITPVILCVETDKGALAALVDDPILLTREQIESDRSNFYLSAKLRGIDALREARDDSSEFIPIHAAAAMSYCDNPDCGAEPEGPCMSPDGQTWVPFHAERLENTRRAYRELAEHYMSNGVKMDGPT